MEVSKIRLSPTEKELVSSAAIILTKNNIIKRAIGLLELVQEEVPEHHRQPDADDHHGDETGLALP